MFSEKPFIHDHFLLENKFAEALYHDYAKGMPILDYHCHLSPADIAVNRTFNNITEAWIHGDHYKWRAMRALGIDEDYITGNAADRDKFQKWAEAVPFTIRNPLYHWTHLELARYFDRYELLNGESAEMIYHDTTERLNSDNNGCLDLLERMNVEVVCTTDDPVDSLENHKNLAQSNSALKMSMSFRPDRALQIDQPHFADYIETLETASKITVNSFDSLCEALKARMRYFDSNGCKLADHGLNAIYCLPYSAAEVEAAFELGRNRKSVSSTASMKFKSALLQFLAEAYNELGWVQQFHLGALRNNNSRMNALLGADTGWDSIGDFPQAESLSRFLNLLDQKNQLTKTILYNSNPGDNAILATMTGNFNDGSVRGKIQFGSGWWFLDQKDGMTQQLNTLSNMALLSCFIGMITDSRSFLSFPRHEYFRRVLCNILGGEISRGELPQEIPWIGKIVQDICYHNAKEYFNF